ncbi:MAG: BolA family protein [Pseudomonadota bacterium]|nr:BolA family protein [Pseudomonadota bacterium]
MPPIQTALTTQLQSLNPEFLQVENESRGHGGYFEGKESHFKVTVVSAAFAGLRAVQRHQKIYAAASQLLSANGGSIHALAIHAYAPDEWTGQSPDSPNCAHAPKTATP